MHGEVVEAPTQSASGSVGLLQHDLVATVPEFFWELILGIWLLAKGFSREAVAALD